MSKLKLYSPFRYNILIEKFDVPPSHKLYGYYGAWEVSWFGLVKKPVGFSVQRHFGDLVLEVVTRLKNTPNLSVWVYAE